MIGVVYIGHRRFPEIGLPNHEKLLSELRKLDEVKIYDFSKDLNYKNSCPWPEGGAIQVWDFMEAIQNVEADIIIKLRTDLWFTDNSIDVTIKETKLVLDGLQDASFLGDNWSMYVGHEYTKEDIRQQGIVKDYVIIIRKDKIKNKNSIYENINNVAPKKRGCGTKVYGGILKENSNSFNIMCQIYLVRKTYEKGFDPWQVGYDYLTTYVQRGKGHKMPDALPWYMSKKK
jgi:hypothetical protein